MIVKFVLRKLTLSSELGPVRRKQNQFADKSILSLDY